MSRGLGDVYKRQAMKITTAQDLLLAAAMVREESG